MVVHIFGGKGYGKDSPCCANHAFNKTGRDNFNCYNQSKIESVLKSFFMADFLQSIPQEEQAK